MRLSGQKEFVIRFTGPFAKVENLTVISSSFLKKFTGQIVTIENSTVNLRGVYGSFYRKWELYRNCDKRFTGHITKNGNYTVIYAKNYGPKRK